jgi:hypothetical protein
MTIAMSLAEASATSTLPGPAAAQIDFSLTSPPYMSRTDHPQDPLNAYRTLDGDYTRYLRELGDIYRQLAAHLSPGCDGRRQRRELQDGSHRHHARLGCCRGHRRAPHLQVRGRDRLGSQS